MIKAQLVNLGARIPLELKKRISAYCDRKGVKMQFFITEAVREKLTEIEQDALDNKIVDERAKSPRFTSKQDLEKYIQERKKNG
jgi:predicted DNA-binding protein